MKNRIVKSLIAFILISLLMLPSGGFAVLAAEASADLVGISVGNLSIADFDADTTSYDFKVPYTYTPNNFTTVATPEVKAYALDPNAKVTVTQPQTADGGVATIVVENEGNTKTYTVNLTTAAMNLAKDGGFEDGTAYNWLRWTLGFACSVTDTNPHAGSKALNHSNTVWNPVRVYAEDDKTVKANTTYLVTYFARDVNDSGVSWYASNKGSYSSKKYYNEDGTERSGDYLGKLSSEYSRIIQTYVPSADAQVNSLAYGPITMGAANPIEIDEMFVSPLAVTAIAYTGDSSVAIPSDEAKSITFSGKLKNQLGGTHGLENETVSYRLLSAPEGVTLDGTTLTVGTEATEGTALIEMTSTLSFANGFQTKVASIEEITIVPDNRTEVAEALDIQVGKLSIPDFDSKKSEYNMVVPYSYKANNFDAPSVPRVKVIPRNSEAEIKVDYPETVENGVVTVTVTSGEYTKEYKINLSYMAVNEAVDGGMEEGDWVALNSDTVGMVFGGLTPDMKKAGDRSYEFYLKAAWGQLMINPESGFTMAPNVKYLLSYYLRAKAENFTIYASNDKLPSDKVVKHYNEDGSSKGGDSAGLKTDSWTHVIQTYSSATGGTGARFAPTGTANKSMYMDEYYYAPLTATDIVLTGTKYIEKLESGSQSIPLTAKLLNQLGGTHGLEGESITFELVGEYEGVTLSGSTLTITSDAPVGSVPVRAKSTFKNGSQQNVWDIVEFDIIDDTTDLTINISKSEIVPGETEAFVFTKGIGKNLTLYIALYEETENGHILADVDSAEASSASDGVIKARVFVDVPDDSKDYTIRAFLWNENLEPVTASAIIE